jgi:hypothetical protein
MFSTETVSQLQNKEQRNTNHSNESDNSNFTTKNERRNKE